MTSRTEAGGRRRRGAHPRLLIVLAALSVAACGSTRSDPTAPVPVTAPVEEQREVVVLVHGMGRSHLSMIPLSWTLERAGYRVVNWGYSSVCCGIAELAGRLRRDLGSETAGDRARVHFVGHSLGNIIIRRVLASDVPGLNVGRVVMLAPPNQGSSAADRLAGPLGWLLKPLPELRTGDGWDDPSLEVPDDVVVGIIAGEHDGKVSVPQTRLEGMDDHVVLPAMHSFLMYRSDVHRLILEFLRDGAFSPDRSPDPVAGRAPAALALPLS